jgi:PAS domain S-box-containing protein
VSNCADGVKSLNSLGPEIIKLTIELLKNMSVISILLFLCLQRYPQIIPHRNGKFSCQGTAFFSLLALAFMIVTLDANGIVVDLRASSIILAAVYLGMRESIMVAFITVIIRIVIGPGWLPWAVTALFLGPISVLVLRRMSGRKHIQVFFITAVMSTLFALGVFVLVGRYCNGGVIPPDMLEPGKLLNIFVPIFVGNMVGTTVLDWAIRRTMDSRRLQDQLAQNEEKYRLLFHSSNDGILVRPLNGSDGPPRFLEVNDMACKQVGYTREELLAKTYVDITDPGANINFKENNDRITQAGHALFQVVNIHKTGKKVPLEINAHLFSFEGQPAVLSVTRDISERFEAEAAIRESEERFRYMANHVPIMIWMGDRKGKFIFINQRWQEYTGTAPESDEWGSGIHPDDRQLSLGVYSNAARNQTGFHAEYRQLHYDGQYRWVSASGVPRYDAKGEFTGFIGCCVDIHDKKLATEALQQAHQHLERRVEERTMERQ